MRRHVLPALLVLLALAARRSSAWATRPGCADVIVGESGPYGADVAPGATQRVLEHADQTAAWRNAGALSRISMSFSWKAGCLEGIRATYGGAAGESLMLGQDAKLSTQVLKLGELERVTSVDFKQDPGKCIELIRLNTDRGQAVTLGNARSGARRQSVAAPPGAWLAAFQGQHGVSGAANGTQVQGRLQNFLLVWAKEECSSTPSTAPAAVPAAALPAAPPAPLTTATPWAACPAVPGRCEPAAPAANISGVDAAAGKCRWPLCKLNGLGTDMLALDLLCYGRNSGPFGGLNKCRNLACRLAVPGCQSGPIHGHCIGSVEAAAPNLDAAAAALVGRPCVEVINHPGPFLNMPLSASGLPVPRGEYVGALWTPCDCGGGAPSPALAALPSLELRPELLGPKAALFAALAKGEAPRDAEAGGECRGPLCALLAQLPALNVTLGSLRLPLALSANLSALARPVPLPGAAPLFAGLVPAIKLPERLPELSLTLPRLPSFDEVAAAFAGATAKLEPALSKVLGDGAGAGAANVSAGEGAPATAAPRRWQPVSKADLAGVVAALLPRLRFERPDLDMSMLGWGGRGAVETAAPVPDAPSSPPSPAAPAPAAADGDADEADLLELLRRLLRRLPELPDSLKLTLPGFVVPGLPKANMTGGMPSLSMPSLSMPSLSMPSLTSLANISVTLPKVGGDSAHAGLVNLLRRGDADVGGSAAAPAAPAAANAVAGAAAAPGVASAPSGERHRRLL